MKRIVTSSTPQSSADAAVSIIAGCLGLPLGASLTAIKRKIATLNSNPALDALEFRRAVLEFLGLGPDSTTEDVLAQLEAKGFRPDHAPEQGAPLPGKPGYDALSARERKTLAEVGGDLATYLHLRSRQDASRFGLTLDEVARVTARAVAAGVDRIEALKAAKKVRR